MPVALGAEDVRLTPTRGVGNSGVNPGLTRSGMGDD